MAATTLLLSNIVATSEDAIPVITEAALASDSQSRAATSLLRWPLAVERETLAQ